MDEIKQMLEREMQMYRIVDIKGKRRINKKKTIKNSE